MATVDFLRRVSIFAQLEPQQLQFLLKKFRRHHYHRNEVVFHQGDPAGRMHIIIEGRIRISIASEDGRETDIALLQSGDCFGEMALLDDSNRSATATALVPSESIALLRQDFLDFLNENPRVVSEVNNMLVERLRSSNQMLGDMVFLDVPTRVAKHLLRLAEDSDDDEVILVPIGQDELAHLVGASRETVSRALNGYRRMGILSTSHRRIMINDLPRLKHMASPDSWHKTT